jgi:hypothetical protein
LESELGRPVIVGASGWTRSSVKVRVASAPVFVAASVARTWKTYVPSTWAARL